MLPRAKKKGLLLQRLPEELLLYDLGAHQIHKLGPVAAEIWQLSNGRRSIDEIAHELHDKNPDVDVKVVEAGLEQLRVAGIMESAPRRSTRRSLLKHVAVLIAVSTITAPRPKAACGESVTRLSTIGLITADRPRVLERALRSHLTAKLSNVEVVVVDDSRSAPARQLNRRVLQAIQRRQKIDCAYLGSAEKARYATRLSRAAKIDPEIVRFALLGTAKFSTPTTGTSRNALLFDAVGRKALSLDDDTEGEYVTSANRDTRITRAVEDPQEYWFSSAHLEKTDALLENHERLLGRTFRSLGFSNAVRVTLSGVYDHASGASCVPYLALADASRKRLIASERLYREVIRGGYSARGVTHDQITRCDELVQFGAAVFAFDHRVILPPFFPLTLREDTLWARTLSVCFQNYGMGLAHTMVRHRRSKRWRFPNGSAGRVELHLADVMCALFDAVLFAERSTGRNALEKCGDLLFGISSAPRSRFRELVFDTADRQARSTEQVLSEQLRRYRRKPTFWAKDLERSVTALVLSRTQRRFPLAREMKPDLISFDIWQKTIRSFALLLKAWPALIDAAVDLRARGVRVAEPLS